MARLPLVAAALLAAGGEATRAGFKMIMEKPMHEGLSQVVMLEKPVDHVSHPVVLEKPVDHVEETSHVKMLVKPVDHVEETSHVKMLVKPVDHVSHPVVLEKPVDHIEGATSHAKMVDQAVKEPSIEHIIKDAFTHDVLDFSPTRLAASLVEASAPAQNAAHPNCATDSGHSHCIHCALPMIKEIVAKVEPLKDDVWNIQKGLATTAGTVCTASPPSGRAGGVGKCCATGVTSPYAPAGYHTCTGGTFSPVLATDVTGVNLKLNAAGSYQYIGAAASTMVTDCCDKTSTCYSNYELYTKKLTDKIMEVSTKHTALNAHIQASKSASDERAAQSIEIKTKIDARHHICTMSPSEETIQNWPTSVGEIARRCVTGQAPVLIAEAAKLIAAANVEIQDMQKATSAVKQTNAWADSATQDQGVSYADGGTPGTSGAAMLALLERTHHASPGGVAGSALGEALQVVQNARNTEKPDFSQAAILLRSIDGKLGMSLRQSMNQRSKIEQDKEVQLTNMASQIKALSDEQGHAEQKEALANQNMADARAAQSLAETALADLMKEYETMFVERESNARSCTRYMEYFDGEAVVNSAELLSLKKVIDILGHVTCPPQSTAAPAAPVPANSSQLF
jgi:hypothetical protein